ncbi:MAG TPA: PEP-CTERM sorting domain-containing protein [Pirellulales bacterium]|jgi:hypothetical protein|nr:PEP-CTERM sorting domain-containing protein [Pirellulales bacterium]
MRKLILTTAILFAGLSRLQAATITGELIDLSVSNTTPGSVHTIEILVKSDAPNGIAAASFDVVSVGTGKANFGTQSGATQANSTSFATSIGVDGYSTVKPNLNVDGASNTNAWFPKPVFGATPDSDFDAIACTLFSTPGAVDSDPADGVALGMTGTFEVVATEKWVFNGGFDIDHLNLYIDNSTYFADSSGGNQGTNSSFDNVVIIGNTPEPASLVLLGCGGLALAAVARRRRFG